MPRRQRRAARPLRSSRIRNALLALSLASVAPLAFADTIGELRALVDANDNTTAWQMAQRMEAENAGDPEFDFYFGLAAKNAGQRNRAIFALERAQLAQPDNPRLKLELADTYYQFGDNGQARVLFEEVLAGSPPEPVQQRIRTYLGAITANERKSGTQVNSYVGLTLGHDSNVSSATDEATHSEGLFAQFTLSPLSMASDAMFLEARAGVDVIVPANQRTIRFLSAGVQRRDNEDMFSGGNFDNSQLNLAGGWLLRRGTATWRLPIGISALWAESESAGTAPVNDDRFQFTLGTEYSRPLSARSGFMLFGRIGETHYPSDLNRNGYVALLGGGYNWSAASSPLTGSVTLHVGTEPVKEEFIQPAGVVPNANGRDYAALRLNLRRGLTTTQAISFSLGAQMSTYHERPPLLTDDREDLLADASLGWQWQASKPLSVNVDVSAMQNDSANTSLYDFDRLMVKAGATWRF